METTTCHSYFTICSAGILQNGIGFVAADNSFFDPAMLGIQPFKMMVMGSARENGYGVYPFSAWDACKQTEPKMDTQEQCLRIVRELSPHIPTLNKIRELYNVTFSIMIVPHVYNENAPILGFNSEIIEFCHATKTEIGIDLYVYGRE